MQLPCTQASAGTARSAASSGSAGRPDYVLACPLLWEPSLDALRFWQWNALRTPALAL